MRDNDVVGEKISLGEVVLFSVWLTEPIIPLSNDVSELNGLNPKTPITTITATKESNIPAETFVSTP